MKKKKKMLRDKREKHPPSISKRSTVFGSSLLLSCVFQSSTPPRESLQPPPHPLFSVKPKFHGLFTVGSPVLLTHEILGCLHCCGQQWHLEWQGSSTITLLVFKNFRVIVCLNMHFFLLEVKAAATYALAPPAPLRNRRKYCGGVF